MLQAPAAAVATPALVQEQPRPLEGATTEQGATLPPLVQEQPRAVPLATQVW